MDLLRRPRCDAGLKFRHDDPRRSWYGDPFDLGKFKMGIPELGELWLLLNLLCLVRVVQVTVATEW